MNEFAFLESQAIVNSDLQVLLPSTVTQDLALIDNQQSPVIKTANDIMVLATSCSSSGQLEIIMDKASQESVINNTKLFASLQPISNKIKLIGIGGMLFLPLTKGTQGVLYRGIEATNNILQYLFQGWSMLVSSLSISM